MAGQKICAIAECGKPLRAKGLCNVHYTRALRASKECSIHDCQKPAAGRGWCGMHWRRWRVYGDPMITKRAANGACTKHIDEVVMQFEGDECLTWPFYRCPAGYAKAGSKNVNRMICERLYGPAPSGIHEAAHSCGKGHEGCVNPNHLRWATPKENAQDRERHGTVTRGEKHGGSKLTENNVVNIRKRVAAGETKASVAKAYGVSRASVRLIVQRKRWSHVC